MAVKQYRCVVGALTIRTQPRTGDQTKTGQQLKMDDVVTVNDDSRVEASGFVWLQHARGWSAERSIDGTFVYLLDTALRPKERQWGINIDPRNPAGNPPAARLAGLGWVRFVFHVSSRNETLDQAFAFYDPIIRAHAQSGTNVLLILIHDTYLGNAPWRGGGDWNTYIRGYAAMVGSIAARYKGLVSAYEIWNEEDQPPAVQAVPTSVYVPPENYGPMLIAAAQAIKLADPAARVISGGLVSGNSLGYMTRVQSGIGGILPIDGMAIHPYGLTPPNVAPFPSWSQGLLGPSILRLSNAFPRIPIWITEIGVPNVDANNRSYWQGIANYMAKTFSMIRTSYFNVVPVLIWFAWADAMAQAGVVNNAQQPKGPIFDTFYQCIRADAPAYVQPQPATPYTGKVMLTHLSGRPLAEPNIGGLAQRIESSSANIKALLIRTSTGTTWHGPDDGKPGVDTRSLAVLSAWAAQLAKYRIDVHAIHEVVGRDVVNESHLIIQLAQAPGMMSLVLDLDPSRLTLQSSKDIRNFMIGLRRTLPATYHIGVSFDGRPDYFKFVNLPEWYPFINSWHPRIYHWLFSGGQQNPAAYLAAAFNALKANRRPIVPMLQAEPSNGRPVPPDHIRQAARLSFETYNVPALSYSQLATIGPQEFSTIQAVYVPWTAGLTPVPTHPDVLVVQTNGPLRIRSSASLDAPTVGSLQPGEQITVLERAVIGSMVWVRHSRGWSASRNAATGEIYLA